MGPREFNRSSSASSARWMVTCTERDRWKNPEDWRDSLFGTVESLHHRFQENITHRICNSIRDVEIDRYWNFSKPTHPSIMKWIMNEAKTMTHPHPPSGTTTPGVTLPVGPPNVICNEPFCITKKKKNTMNATSS